MPEPLELGTSFRIPDTFFIEQRGTDEETGEPIYWLVRKIDKRKTRVIFKPGQTTHTVKELSAAMLQEDDYENPLLRDMLP